MSNANNGYEYIKYNKSRNKNMTALKELFKKSSKAAAGIMGRTFHRVVAAQEEQVALLEKSYEIAARYMNGMMKTDIW